MWQKSFEHKKVREENSNFTLLHKGNFCDRSTLMVTPVLGHQLQTISSIALLRVGEGQDIRLKYFMKQLLYEKKCYQISG